MLQTSFSILYGTDDGARSLVLYRHHLKQRSITGKETLLSSYWYGKVFPLTPFNPTKFKTLKVTFTQKLTNSIHSQHSVQVIELIPSGGRVGNVLPDRVS